jgi:hypothetical protein
MQEPAYQIIVACPLGKEWESRLGDMAIEEVWQCDKYTRTVIQGRPKDKSALLGIIQSLYDHGAPVLSIKQLHTFDKENGDH